MKKVNYVFIILLIMATCMPIISWAFDTSNETIDENTTFFKVEKETASPGETIQMYLYLDAITYENYQFSLTSNVNLETITTQDDIETEMIDNAFVIEGNTSQSTISQITLAYTIPTDIEIGTILELTAIIEEIDIQNDEDESVNTTELEEETINNSEEVTVYIKIVEQSDEIITSTENEENSTDTTKIDNTMEWNQTNTQEQNSMQNTMQSASDMMQDSNQTTTTTLSQTAGTLDTQTMSNTDTYSGESNNYLSNLYVEGYTLNTAFSKTNTTYFIYVDSDITTLDIDAEAEDENASVTIYGNTDLQSGTNKILISVTAENGDVKTYRIYVEKDA